MNQEQSNTCNCQTPAWYSDYRNSAERLSTLALSDTSGGRTAASLLLSSLQGEHHFDISDLLYFDDINYQAAVAYLNGMYHTREYPDSLSPLCRENFAKIKQRHAEEEETNRAIDELIRDA
ncbi:DUF7673 family protein [Halioxenophilus aromaticivorans]|uniref:DUF7673 domain-containing protein n=1 Tax=Halioxenophilus aromaticivorans TaxID=1306992 RepID=A0AAV3U8T3_9ALTE